MARRVQCPCKYQKFIELYGRPITDKDIAENRYGILRVFRQVKAYFSTRIPNTGSSFPMSHGPSDHIEPNV